MKIFLSKDVPQTDISALEKSYWCDVNQKRWIYAADVYAFGEYLLPKLLFRSPYTLVQSETTCMVCGFKTPIIAVEASGYVPTGGKGADLALNIAFFLEGGVEELIHKPVYLTNVQEYPPEFLKLIRPKNFLFRRHEFEDNNEYFANACSTCKAPIDDFQLFYEADGPLARCNSCPTRTETILHYDMPILCEAEFA